MTANNTWSVLSEGLTSAYSGRILEQSRMVDVSNVEASWKHYFPLSCRGIYCKFTLLSILRTSFAILSRAASVQKPQNVLRGMNLIICCQQLKLPPLVMPLRLTLRFTFTLQGGFTSAHALPDLSRNFPRQVP